MINITIENNSGERQDLEVPVDMGFNLMEILKAYEYDIMATCGGMALCATCHIEVLEGADKLPECNDNELATLDTLPDADEQPVVLPDPPQYGYEWIGNQAESFTGSIIKVIEFWNNST
jgi:ferredoxin